MMLWTIEQRFRKMYCDGRTRDLRLVDTKATFREVTQNQDIDFRAELDVLREQFLDAGPGVSSVSLDDGVDLLMEYKKRCAELNKRKAVLINAQNLFDLPVKPYPLLASTCADLEQIG